MQRRSWIARVSEVVQAARSNVAQATASSEQARRKAQAKLRGIPQSPDKVNAVASTIRRRVVDEALAQLTLSNKRAAWWLAKTVRSAAANAVHSKGMSDMDMRNLRVEEAFVGHGRHLKRLDIKGAGTSGIRKRKRCHLTVVVSDRPAQSAVQSQSHVYSSTHGKPRRRVDVQQTEATSSVLQHTGQKEMKLRDGLKPRELRRDGWELQRPKQTPYERHRQRRLRKRGLSNET